MDNTSGLCTTCGHATPVTATPLPGHGVTTDEKIFLTGSACRCVPTPTERARLVTPGRAGELLAVSKRTIYSLIASGELNSVTVGRARRIPMDAIDQFVEELRAEHSETGT